MAMYALGTLPLTGAAHNNLADCTVPGEDGKYTQALFVDDSQAAGRPATLRNWCTFLLLSALDMAYAKSAKTWLVVKPNKTRKLKCLFADTGVNITSDSRRDLGAFTGNSEESLELGSPDRQTSRQ